jgi:hypothetical protein
MDRQWQYLPKVITRIEYMQLDISAERCECCGEWAELHSWVILNHNGTRVIYCSESPPIRVSQTKPVATGITYV